MKKRTARLLKKRQPKYIENVKTCILLKGRRGGEMVNKAMQELKLYKKPDVLSLTRKHDMVPFDDITPVENMLRKYDAPLFIFGMWHVHAYLVDKFRFSFKEKTE